MSKRFFAKWIPIAGEINEGDIVTPSGGDNSYLFRMFHPNGLRKDILFMRHLSTGKVEMNVEGVKKVKLFLCSRDIEVGESVLDEEFCNWIVIEQDLKKLDLLTKIIGEISHHAISVKEGDEFDEWEFNIIYQRFENNVWQGLNGIGYYEGLKRGDNVRVICELNLFI